MLISIIIYCLSPPSEISLMKMGLSVCFAPRSWDYILWINASQILTCPGISWGSS